MTKEAFKGFRTIKTMIHGKDFFPFNVSSLRNRQKMKSSLFKLLLRIVNFAANENIHSFDENTRTFL